MAYGTQLTPPHATWHRYKTMDEGQVVYIRVGSPVENDEGNGVLTITCEPLGGNDCPEDINGDGIVDGIDLAVVLGGWSG